MRKQFLIVMTIIFVILLITISITYAYFTANISGNEETTTITVTGGKMDIVYDGGSSINLNNIIPDDNPSIVKTFTVTGNSTLDIPMNYLLSLIIEENTFSEEALKYKLISTNLNNNGEAIPELNMLTNIGTGPQIIELGNGSFEVPTAGSKVHTYDLEIYFPNQDYNQNIDQGKIFKSYIRIEDFDPISLVYNIEQGVNKPVLLSGMIPIK